MKKLLGFFLCVVFLVFVSAVGVQAVPFNIGAEDLPFVGSNTGNDVGAAGVGNVNAVITAWNDLLAPPDLPEAVNALPQIEVGNDYQSYLITWDGDFTYLTVKYANFFDVYYIAATDGSVGIDWERDFGLSHYTFWDGTHSVPEPATMFLFGSALLGLAALRRKFIK